MDSPSVLQMVLLEEYSRLLRMIEGINIELQTLPKGYISRKNIRGKETFYLQWREGEKIKSKYVSAKDIDELTKVVNRRQSLEKSLRANLKDLKKLESALGKEFIQSNIDSIN